MSPGKVSLVQKTGRMDTASLKNKTDFHQTLFKRVEQTTILEYKRQKDIKEDLYAQGFEQRSLRKT